MHLSQMKKRLNPTEILLKEVPDEGRTYEYSHESAELTETLKELIDDNLYFVTLTVRPIGNAFEVKGELRTQMKLQCSLCAIDFDFPVSEKFHDVLVINDALSKGDQTVKTNHSSEWDWSQPDGIYLEASLFDVAEYIHEVVALAEPIRPLGGKNCEEYCENRRESVQREWLSIGANDTKSVHNHPFSVLGKVKLKS